MKTQFTVHNELQAYVQNIVDLHGQSMIDTFTVTVNDEKSEITLSIEDLDSSGSDFIIKKEDLQKVFDWLKQTQVIV